jgi:hypothetical protein
MAKKENKVRMQTNVQKIGKPAPPLSGPAGSPRDQPDNNADHDNDKQNTYPYTRLEYAPDNGTAIQ